MRFFFTESNTPGYGDRVWVEIQDIPVRQELDSLSMWGGSDKTRCNISTEFRSWEHVRENKNEIRDRLFSLGYSEITDISEIRKIFEATQE